MDRQALTAGSDQWGVNQCSRKKIVLCAHLSLEKLACIKMRTFWPLSAGLLRTFNLLMWVMKLQEENRICFASQISIPVAHVPSEYTW